ncbi:hypothetical protein DL93DRAFT_2088801 [Clavulina sp. PMI_390]|nr:hypothetical protein DL93DRAFT_2088801 [Clavulina sp. PMI_390]
MFPKVLLYGARAAVHGQQATASTFRNALQLPTLQSGQLVSGPSVANSNWGGGSQQYSYHGYTGAGRAITHANSSVNDSNRDPGDDSDDILPVRSISKHASRPSRLSSRSARLPGQRFGPVRNLSTARPGVLDIVKKQSTVAEGAMSSTASHSARRHSTSSTPTQRDDDSSALPTPPPSPPSEDAVSENLLLQISQATATRDRELLMQLIVANDLCTTSPNFRYSRAVYDALLQSLAELQPPSASVSTLIEVYNAMLAADFLPDSHTFTVLIRALLTRDSELMQVTSGAASTMSSRHLGAQEMNYESAVAMFEAGVSLAQHVFPHELLASLLQACASRGDAATAHRIWQRSRTSLGVMAAESFAAYLKTHCAAGNLSECEAVFAAYQEANKEGTVLFASTASPLTVVYDEMIAAYITLGSPELALEQLEMMMDSALAPSPATYNAIIRAFCSVGDAESALAWFRRLQGLSVGASTPIGLWRDVMQALARQSMIQEINRQMVQSLSSTSNAEIAPSDVTAWLKWNAELLPALPRIDQQQELTSIAHQIGHYVSDSRTPVAPNDGTLPSDLQKLVAVSVEVSPSTSIQMLRALTWAVEPLIVVDPSWRDVWRASASVVLSSATTNLPANHAFEVTIDIARMFQIVAPSHTAEHLAGPFSTLYLSTTSPDLSSLTEDDWSHIVNSVHHAVHTSADPPSLVPVVLKLMQDIVRLGWMPADVPTIGNLIRLLQVYLGTDAVHHMLQVLPGVSEHLSESWPTAKSSVVVPVKINLRQSHFVDQHTSSQKGDVSPQMCFSRYESGILEGLYPTPEVAGRLVNALGRLGEIDMVQNVYSSFQALLQSLEHDKRAQSSAWFLIEDQMVASLAHAGDLDAANMHRLRILQQGGAPCADSYGALIAAVKSTTDDSSLAQELFEEAERLRVTPNSYLYNTVISKMAKARKTEYALELFHRMPYLGLRPTAVTYAAVIGACCRVGDGDSAVFLFDEMLTLPHYRPRVPVYNSMIQFFVSQRKDRDNALQYYHLMLEAGLRPSEHTYKLLLDAYGSIEPLDAERLEATFAEACAHGQPQGSHWAAMINAWGSVARDLDRTLTTFQACAASARGNLPDSCVYEALFNALFANGRADLVPTYLDDMAKRGVHSTAYIAAVLVKGYSEGGDIEAARRVFAGLVDPPLGVAAPHNHQINNAIGLNLVPADAPVFREVCQSSTISSFHRVY